MATMDFERSGHLSVHKALAIKSLVQANGEGRDWRALVPGWRGSLDAATAKLREEIASGVEYSSDCPNKKADGSCGCRS